MSGIRYYRAGGLREGATATILLSFEKSSFLILGGTLKQQLVISSSFGEGMDGHL